MGFQVKLQHRTGYRYSKPVSLGPQTIQLRPTSYGRTPILSYTLNITPAGHTLYWQLDPQANYAARVLFPGKTSAFTVDVSLTADLTPVNPFAFVLEPGFQDYPFAYSPELLHDLQPCLGNQDDRDTGPLLRRFVEAARTQRQSTVGFLVALNARVRNDIAYTTRLEHGVQTPEQTLSVRSGSCRDSAWLLVQVCRKLGIAARFVSGYLIQLASGQPDGPAADSADLHAWCEVFLPGAGWIGLDPTSGLLTAEGHIPLACTTTPSQAAPIGGTVEPAEVDFHFSLSIARLPDSAGDKAPGDDRNRAPGSDLEAVPGASPEPPPDPDPPPLAYPDSGRDSARPITVAEPFTGRDWLAVSGLAHTVDRDLQHADVRLTMGGEPTFVGIDETESLQWNLEALGPLKRTRGLSLIRDLRRKTAPGGLLHLGQGKWYPGEALPRWAFHCISRNDGAPVWENLDLIASENPETPQAPEAAPESIIALDFLQALTRRLQVRSENIVPAHNPGLETEAEDPAGYLLPLRRRQFNGQLIWSSQLWFPTPHRLTLSWGDSPIGYRITVESMPFVAPDELTHEFETGTSSSSNSPTEPGLVKLPPGPARRPELFQQQPQPDPLPPLSSTAETATELIRPALCAQVREGRLHIFLPYVPIIADYLDLIAAIEDTAQHLTQPIWIEGYTPPTDPRIRSFSLTPDPGVLEVNLPPTASWDDLESVNLVLHEEAEKNRLTASKFAYDGTHQATGGGSHIVLGGATVTDSPLLRRPDLLRSMVAFWQNHPSLSYLFSGMYVGPTSQYPRVDEARTDALYELEVAFSQLSPQCPPDVLNGLFRNLLVDVTGNAHRAEFCIDKLYPPLGQGLRLGLLELRAFEMTPHPRMGLLQMLLIRALVLDFWNRPYTGGLHRWGAALHDRFMLPHFVEQDFAEVLGHLCGAGYDFQPHWFAAQHQFRFPHIGSVTAQGPGFAMQLELRQALEPWNVLAEETTSGGTGRSVDSSLERMQVKLSGLPADATANGTGPRYIVACNGRRVPLHRTGVPGEAVAGIRYRARKLSAALHPTVPVHTPLTFDLIDTATRRSLARCTYFAGPPDGSVHTTRPADADEARQRRRERFVVSSGTSSGPSHGIAIPPEEHNTIFPMTLDLRWPAPGETPPAPPPEHTA